MKSQRRFLLFYFGTVLAVFYSVYYYIVKGVPGSLSRYSIDRYVGRLPKPFLNKCIIYYDAHLSGSTKGIALAVARRFIANGVDSEASAVEGYKYAGQLKESSYVLESQEDLLDLSSPFNVVLQYVEDPPTKGDFDVVVHGGRLLVFSLSRRAVMSNHTERRVYDLIQGIFFKNEGMPSTSMTPLLDLTFVFMSDKVKVAWSSSLGVIRDLFFPIANALSLFYDISTHSRVISGANFTATMKLKSNGNVDLQEQPFEMFDFLERIINVELGTRDSFIYRHTLAFVCHAPSQVLRFYDRALHRETESVAIKGTGVLSFVDINDENVMEYTMGRDDAELLIGSWATHIRRMHNLPPSRIETVAESLNADDVITVLDDGLYFIDSSHHSFTIRLQPPGLVSFYGFEVSKIANSLYHIYLKGALDALHKVVKPLSKISFMTRVSPAAVNSAKESHEAIGCLYGVGCDGLPSNNMEALALARTAFKQALEAMGDDETYAKNAVSVEHGIASLMCDAFPFVFPMLANALKYVLER
ncbi:uncharacterized protein BXIN_0904 [Babesia sp. Xinjiang]|uniref:uncharacterized protein n=1 Tax=Babesia sp. Xinjiang TaxID=462227 RepID=UPI000A24E2A2|nr:uncharacterized protein BXIN_0904 [Babesia sp. Xinjiang]ORM42053.1 hypothetical protein BXIN_0904 [Babesia sp. Xinjiang]